MSLTRYIALSLRTTSLSFIRTETSRDVIKTNVKSRICCVSWTNDGRYIALGMADGQISLREGYKAGSKTSGQQKIEIKPRGGPPIWSLMWNPSKGLPTDELVSDG